MAADIGAVTPENIISRIIASKEVWDANASYTTGILKGKVAEERRRQSGGTP